MIIRAVLSQSAKLSPETQTPVQTKAAVPWWELSLSRGFRV